MNSYLVKTYDRLGRFQRNHGGIEASSAVQAAWFAWHWCHGILPGSQYPSAGLLEQVVGAIVPTFRTHDGVWTFEVYNEPHG